MSYPPITSFTGEYRFLSNFAPVCVVMYHPEAKEYVAFPSVEAAYQAAKNVGTRNWSHFMGSCSPAHAKRLGRQFPLRPDWDQVKLDIMRYLLEQKFAHPLYREKLLATYPAELIEGNTWNDTFWGVCRGKGENHLGKLLMEIRHTSRT